jgi:hypothetical protein
VAAAVMGHAPVAPDARNSICDAQLSEPQLPAVAQNDRRHVPSALVEISVPSDVLSVGTRCYSWVMDPRPTGCARP